MRATVKKNPYIKLGYKFLTSFIEVAKPYLSLSEYNFYMRVIEDINFDDHPINVGNYIDFIIDKILETSIKNMQ